MPFPPDVELVLNYLDGFSAHGLLKRDDLGALLDIAAEQDIDQEINALIFNGAFLHNLYSTLRKTSASAEGYDVLQREFSAATATVRDLLAGLLARSTDQTLLHRCQTHYFAMTQGALRNLVDLCGELAVLKRVQNDRKRGNADESSG